MNSLNINNQLQPIQSQSVVERVMSQIMNCISTGVFVMGEKMPSEHELVEMLGISRNSLREAMKILSALGIVEIRRGDGTYVCNHVKPTILDSAIYNIIMGSSSDQEIVELRQLLDENILTLALKKCSVEEIDELQTMIDKMREMFGQGNISEAAKLDYEFHMRLNQCARNPFLEHIVVSVYQLFKNSIENNIRTESLFAMAAEHHQAIVDCLRSRDEKLIKSVVSNSLSSWKQNIRKKI